MKRALGAKMRGREVIVCWAGIRDIAVWRTLYDYDYHDRDILLWGDIYMHCEGYWVSQKVDMGVSSSGF